MIMSLLNYFENRITYPDVQLDRMHLRVISYSCRSRKELQEKLISDLTYRNQQISDNIKNWVSTRTPIRLPDITNIVTSSVSPPQQIKKIRDISVKRQYIKQDERKIRTILPLQQLQCPINVIEISDRMRTQSTRLHAHCLAKAIEEIKFLHENQLIIVRNTPKYENYNKIKLNKVDHLYTQHISYRRRRTFTDADLATGGHINLRAHFY